MPFGFGVVFNCFQFVAGIGLCSVQFSEVNPDSEFFCSKSFGSYFEPVISMCRPMPDAAD